jgi:hypothetical protein
LPQTNNDTNTNLTLQNNQQIKSYAMSASSLTTAARDIDFLPASYYQADLQRKHATWRVVVVAMFAALILFAAIYQQYIRSMADRQLTELLPQYEVAKAQTQRLAQLQQSLIVAEKRADLVTYLKHPWPRSQILAALSQSLLDEIELNEISISREPLTVTDQTATHSAVKPGEAAAAKLDATDRDLLSLRELCDHSQIVVKCSGLTDDPAALHSYLEQLSHNTLLAKVEVGSMERVSGDANSRIRFTARIIVQPGYGQSGGPKTAVEKVTAAISNEQH